jgi:hypothetical protein
MIMLIPTIHTFEVSFMPCLVLGVVRVIDNDGSVDIRTTTIISDDATIHRSIFEKTVVGSFWKSSLIVT